MGGVEAGSLLAGRYLLQAVVRRDGTGVVWLASDALRREDVVLRAVPWVPPADDGGREPWRERAVREARALARLDHPNVIGVIDMFEHDGRPWMVFDAAPYRFPYSSLSDLVRVYGPLRPAQAAGVGWHVLAAIRQAHAVGVLHRDVKPGSILLGPGNRVVLTDFGMVTADGSPALTTPEPLIGSPRYMAPERARGEPGDACRRSVVAGRHAVRDGGGTAAVRWRRHGRRGHRRPGGLSGPSFLRGTALAGDQRVAPQGSAGTPGRRRRRLAAAAGRRTAGSGACGCSAGGCAAALRPAHGRCRRGARQQRVHRPVRTARPRPGRSRPSSRGTGRTPRPPQTSSRGFGSPHRAPAAAGGTA